MNVMSICHHLVYGRVMIEISGFEFKLFLFS